MAELLRTSLASSDNVDDVFSDASGNATITAMSTNDHAHQSCSGLRTVKEADELSIISCRASSADEACKRMGDDLSKPVMSVQSFEHSAPTVKTTEASGNFGSDRISPLQLSGSHYEQAISGKNRRGKHRRRRPQKPEGISAGRNCAAETRKSTRHKHDQYTLAKTLHVEGLLTGRRQENVRQERSFRAATVLQRIERFVFKALFGEYYARTGHSSPLDA